MRSTESAGNATDRAEPDRGEPGLITSAFGEGQVPGTGGPWRWFFTAVWLVYLIQPVAALFGHDNGVAWIVGGLAIAAAFCAIYLYILIYADERPRLAEYGLAAIAILAALACVVYGKGWTALWIYVSAATGIILVTVANRQVATLGVGVVGACYVFFSWLSHVDTTSFLIVLLPVLLIGLAMMGFRMQISLMHELAQARGTVAKLAANEERLRLARDMHDLTGQSLSMITLKSELAAKRLAKLTSSAERDAVLTELGDIGRVSRQTLHDIREAVSGYRRPTLAIEVITARHALEADLRKALANSEFEVYYQTVFSFETGAICGAEALVRWFHPERGTVRPDQFIPLAEELGLIVSIGEWVLKTACMQAVKWPANLKLAVNLSAAQFKRGNLVATVRSALAESGLAPERLELEITESVLLTQNAYNLALLRGLKQLGVSIVLDDFGTGFSSLSYLRMFPFDTIKIDRSFVCDMSTREDCAAIIAAVTSLSRTLGIRTTAEGVETREQFDLLRAAGCTLAQGFMLSKPRPAAELDFSPPLVALKAAS